MYLDFDIQIYEKNYNTVYDTILLETYKLLESREGLVILNNILDSTLKMFDTKEFTPEFTNDMLNRILTIIYSNIAFLNTNQENHKDVLFEVNQDSQTNYLTCPVLYFEKIKLLFQKQTQDQNIKDSVPVFKRRKANRSKNR